MKKLQTIDDVILLLDKIIDETTTENNTLGYFAALYQKVTVKVKNAIEKDEFDNGERMEKLDIVFAERYINAYYAYKNNKVVTYSWQKTFDISSNYWPIVLQHLLIGMNAHINLDLGIAAAEISKNKDIDDLKNDFNKINEILSSLVNEVQDNLANIWPTLKKILRHTKKVDDFLIDFSMELARDGAWEFAKKLSETQELEFQNQIKIRDEKIAKKADIITSPGFFANLIFKLIRLGEKGSTAVKINQLKS